MFKFFQNADNRSATVVRSGLDDGSLILVDVREVTEFRGERIGAAINMPLSRFDPTALARVADPSKVVFQCQSGMRSMRALKACRAAGIQVNGNLACGIGAWKAAGFATVRG
ncbi:MAG: rhodanese-like domain-containing protein [Brevundimonas sp.]